jgi:hypothetical protein
MEARSMQMPSIHTVKVSPENVIFIIAGSIIHRADRIFV